jgi:pimeloyl-ACP methyl ester carboxylesterase
MIPQTRYARSGKVNIAYQVTGDGPLDLVYVPGWVSHLELRWEEPDHARFLHRLASFSRLITFDKRGTGLADRVPDDELPSLEVRMDDLRAVMDAVGSQRAALFGYSEGGNMCMLFTATYPERTVALVTYSCFAKRIRSPITRGRRPRRHAPRNTKTSSANGATRWTSRITFLARCTIRSSRVDSRPIFDTPQVLARQWRYSG